MRNSPQVICSLIAFLATAGLILASGEAEAATGAATLSWYPPTENADGSAMSDLAGYRIYYGKYAANLDRTIVIDNPGLTRYVVEGLSSTRWHFAMSSVNSNGKESARSKTVSKLVR